MELNYIMLQRVGYGDNKGLLSGEVKVSTPSGKIELTLNEERVEQILVLLSEQLVESAKEVAHDITREVIEHKPALEAPDA